MVNGGLCEELIDHIMPGKVLLDHAIDGAPVGQATQVAIVDKDIHLELAREMRIVIGRLLGVIAIHRIELQAASATPFYGLLEKLPFANRPQNQLVAILAQHLQGIDGKGYLLAYLRIFMGDDGAIEIDCDSHC